MHTAMSKALWDEIQQYRLALTCEDCLHFRADTEGCDLLYPTAPHRRAALETAAADPSGPRIWFCKMFEAG